MEARLRSSPAGMNCPTEQTYDEAAEGQIQAAGRHRQTKNAQLGVTWQNR